MRRLYLNDYLKLRQSKNNKINNGKGKNLNGWYSRREAEALADSQVIHVEKSTETNRSILVRNQWKKKKRAKFCLFSSFVYWIMMDNHGFFWLEEILVCRCFSSFVHEIEIWMLDRVLLNKRLDEERKDIRSDPFRFDRMSEERFFWRGFRIDSNRFQKMVYVRKTTRWIENVDGKRIRLELEFNPEMMSRVVLMEWNVVVHYLLLVHYDWSMSSQLLRTILRHIDHWTSDQTRILVALLACLENVFQSVESYHFEYQCRGRDFLLSRSNFNLVVGLLSICMVVF